MVTITQKSKEQDAFRYLMSPSLFCKDILGFEVRDFHKEILDFQTMNKKTMVLAPRSSGKSSIGNIGYVLWSIVRDPTIRILVCSNTQGQAESYMYLIRTHLESNEKLINLFGELKGNRTWTNSELEVKKPFGYGRTSKEKTVTALGVGGSLIGKHHDIVIADDIVDDDRCYTQAQRDKIEEWYYMVLLPMLEPTGEIHMLGTRWNADDLYGRLIGKTDNNSNPIYNMKRLQIWKDEKNRISLWDERFKPDYIDSLKAEAGTVWFSMQYMNEVKDIGVSPIRSAWINFISESEVPYEKLSIFQGVDLSTGEAKDYFGHCTIGIDKESNDIYVIDTFQDKLSFLNQQKKIVEYDRAWYPRTIGLETNGYQMVMAQELIRKHGSLPIKPIHQIKDKITRLTRTSAAFEMGRVYFVENKTDTLYSQIMDGNKAVNDDVRDAFLCAYDVAFPTEKPVRTNMTWNKFNNYIHVR